MTTNVAILTNFRTGSTSFTLKKAEQYDLPYKGELFSHEKPHRIGNLLNTAEFNKKYQYKDHNIVAHALSNWNIFDELRLGNAEACYKIMPSHFNKRYNQRTSIDTFQIQTILEHADKVYYLYRRDFRAQIKSWLAVRRDGSFGHTGFTTNVALSYQTPEEDYAKRMYQLHLGKAGQTPEPYRATFDPADPVFHAKTNMSIESLVNQLVVNYNSMAEIYKRVPGELVCYEDYFSGEQYNPYNRDIKWTSEPEIDQYVDNWDIEGLFK
tara:strand:+ start:109 stop:909 length:801 start_codon:yes stop_codon:yes gene_type:complete